MFGLNNSYSFFYTLFTWSLGICYGFVLISSAAGNFDEFNFFEKGVSLKYNLKTNVLLNDKGLKGKNVGFTINGEVSVGTIWENGNQKLLKIELKPLKLHMLSDKITSDSDFSNLDNADNKPFLVIWNKGKIDKIFISKSESISMKNVKKGIASLLQFQLVDVDSKETDSSGTCVINYSSLSPHKFSKLKTHCISDDFDYIDNLNKILGVEIESNSSVEYVFNEGPFRLASVVSKDVHVSYLTSREEMGNRVETEQILTYITSENIDSVNGDYIEDAVEKISKTTGITFNQENLLTEIEPVKTNEIVTFNKVVGNLRNNLKIEHIGSIKQAKAIIELVNSARNAKKEDISKVLTSKKNKNILHQLYDILGYVQTSDSHETVMKNLHFDKEDQIDLSERYLWALSFSSHPNPDVLEDVLKKFTKTVSIPEKVKETMILTMASMAYKVSQRPHSEYKFNLIRDVEETIINNLDYAKNEDKHKYFRALKNLKSPTTTPILLEYIKKGTQKEGVLAWKAIKAFGSTLWDKEVLMAAKQAFFQLNKRYDTSSRTIAVDILLESQPSDELLVDILNFLISKDPAYEIKQYVYQRIKMLTESDDDFKYRVEKIIKNSVQINNYSGLAPRGLSTALTRTFYKHPSSNGSLVSVQEMKSGIAKRGSIDVVFQKGDIRKEIFSLGIFSGGLHTFLSSGNEEEETEEENPTAGIELTVMDTQIRPFVFFSGQGELMGHVWSGTASEKTPAFQILALLQDHFEYIRLSPGFIMNVNFKGAASFDLSGKIEISIWSRTAESLVQKTGGIVVVGVNTIDSSFIKTQVEFGSLIETKLDLQTDIDFSSNAQLCMRLTQPDSVFRHNIYKMARVPGNKHQMRISKYQKYNIPGLTYNINKKNNDMCKSIFS
ncbi:microsomal triacylglycerol transfer protein [Diorhabda carinulata]|uniref:microsomal triacylglycerol transfer protein n=1 Tax=Diorhabda carinulata TaxID=1163345 RepID=UPI0025A0B399|nr:microsomal triacylglycerol transfer protein [Diorhabda carinulata]XP_057665551.1 microsomal triacylglycerol transfer protein [Diorhabda carinulata]